MGSMAIALSTTFLARLCFSCTGLLKVHKVLGLSLGGSMSLFPGLSSQRVGTTSLPLRGVNSGLNPACNGTPTSLLMTGDQGQGIDKTIITCPRYRSLLFWNSRLTKTATQLEFQACCSSARNRHRMMVPEMKNKTRCRPVHVGVHGSDLRHHFRIMVFASFWS